MSAVEQSSEGAGRQGTIQVFYDGHCPVCSREMKWLRRKASRKGLERQIMWVDIASPSFDPQHYGSSGTQEDFMAVFHVYDGRQMHRAMDAVRALYRFLGLGVWLNWSGYPPFRPFVDLLYHLFAYFRPRVKQRQGKRK